LRAPVSAILFSLAKETKKNFGRGADFYQKNKDENDEKIHDARISIEAVNTGRRLIILTGLGASYDNNSRTMYLGKHPDGIELKEKQRYLVDSSDVDFLIVDMQSGAGAIDFWFEDSLGDKHRVKGTKRHLLMYFQSQKIEDKLQNLGKNKKL
jgi:hypothetical protein